MSVTPEGTGTDPDTAATDPVLSGRGVAMMVLACGGFILRHWIPADQRPAGPPYTPPHRFTMHGWDEDKGCDIDRAMVRELFVRGLITWGKTPAKHDIPRKMVITDKGVDQASASLAAIYLAAIADDGPTSVPLSTRKSDILRDLFDGDDDLRLEHHGDRGWWLKGRSLSRHDVEPLIAIGFLEVEHFDVRPQRWKLTQDAVDWLWARMPVEGQIV